MAAQEDRFVKRLIPVTVVSGFLGSGKTTLLCDLLKHRQERRLAVLINEIGEVSIDGALARASAGDVEIVDFPSGLIAYAEDTQFVPTMQAIARRAVQVDHVLIETSGVALPSAAMARLQEPQLVNDFVLDATLVVVDTPRLLAGEFGQVGGASGGGKSAAEGVATVGAGGSDEVGSLHGDGVGAGSGDGQDEASRVAMAGAGGSGEMGALHGDGAGAESDDKSQVGANRVATLAAGGSDTVAAGGGVGVSRMVAGEAPGAGAADDNVALSAAKLFEQQLGAADVVVLNKIDGLDEDELLRAEGEARRRAPRVRFLELAHGAKLDVSLALGLRLHQPGGASQGRAVFRGPFAVVPGAESRTLADHGRVDGHSHSGLTAHAHGLETHSHFHEQDPGWLSFTLRCRERQDVGTLRGALESVADAEPLLRCKGFALGPGSDRPVLLQGVRTRVVVTEASPKLAPKSSELVFIGYHLSRVRVAAMLSRLTGKTWS